MDRKDQHQDKDKDNAKKHPGVEGEGSYSGSKDYNERTKKFVDSGKVDDAARAAKPQSEEEAHQMHKAERIGKQHARGEDPALKNPSKVPHQGHGHDEGKKH